jgi:hypothetical protein
VALWFCGAAARVAAMLRRCSSRCSDAATLRWCSDVAALQLATLRWCNDAAALQLALQRCCGVVAMLRCCSSGCYRSRGCNAAALWRCARGYNIALCGCGAANGVFVFVFFFKQPQERNRKRKIERRGIRNLFPGSIGWITPAPSCQLLSAAQTPTPSGSSTSNSSNSSNNSRT